MGNIQANENHNGRKMHLQKELELRIEFCHNSSHYNKNIFKGQYRPFNMYIKIYTYIYIYIYTYIYIYIYYEPDAKLFNVQRKCFNNKCKCHWLVFIKYAWIFSVEKVEAAWFSSMHETDNIYNMLFLRVLPHLR